MTVVNGYTTGQAIKKRVGIRDAGDDILIDDAINSASRAIDIWCGQIFYDAGTPATARRYQPASAHLVRVDPFSTTTGLVVETDTNDDATWSTVWASTDYELVMFGGAMADMMAAPYDQINAVGSYTFPTYTRRTLTVRVTARWGWGAVPQPVVEATKILAVDLWKRKDVAFGMQTGAVDFAGLRINRDTMAQVSSILTAYRRVDRVGVGFA